MNASDGTDHTDDTWLGLDIGTFSSVGVLSRGSESWIIADPVSGVPWTRTSIARDESGMWLIGTSAEDYGARYPSRYRGDLKRLLASDVPVVLGEESWQPVELVAQMIGWFAGQAREQLGGPIDRLVLAVPVSFEGSRQAAMVDAAKRAGFASASVELVVEPLLAARSLLHDSPYGTYLVFDLGGGTLDLALVRKSGPGLELIDTLGDASLGGIDFDDCVMNDLAELGNIDLDELTGPLLHDLREKARQVKERLSESESTQPNLPWLESPPTYSRDDLAKSTEHILDRAVRHCEALLASHRFEWEDLAGIVLAGHPTKSPIITERLATHTNRIVGPMPTKSADPSSYHNQIKSPRNYRAQSSLTAPISRMDTDVELQDPAPAAVSHDDTVSAWKEFAAPATTDWVNSVCQLSDRRLATASRHTIRIWDLLSEEPITLSSHIGDVRSVVELSDGRLASASDDNTIKIWDLATRKPTATLTGHTKGATSVCELSDGRLASASYDNTIKIWDLATQRPTATLTGHTGWVMSVIQLSDGRLASAGHDDAIRIWDLATQEETTLTGHKSWISSACELSDGRLASASDDNTIKIWDLATRKPTATLTGHTKGATSVCELSDGRLASASYDNTIKIWDLATQRPTATLTGHTGWVMSVIQLSDGRLASAGHDDAIRIWEGVW